MTDPKGTLIAIGGNEKKELNDTEERFQIHFGEGFILQDILKYAGDSKSRIEVITSASEIPEVVGRKYTETFKRLGVENVGILNIISRQRANHPKTLRRIEEADAILFSGGDQCRISRFLKETKSHHLIVDRYINDSFVIAGTSAGAVAMSEEMIAGGRTGNILRKDDLKMGKGLGLMKQVIFDSHFIRRHRFGRLAEAVALYPDKLGVGLGEDTGVVITEGNKLEIIGSGMVVLFDGSNLVFNQYHQLKNKVAVSLANLTVHILATKDKYYIREKKAEIHYDANHHKGEFTKFE